MRENPPLKVKKIQKIQPVYFLTVLKFWLTENPRKVPFQRYWLRDPFTFKEVFFIRWSLTKSSFRFNLLLDSPCSVCGLTYLLFALSKMTCMIESGFQPIIRDENHAYIAYICTSTTYIDLLTYWPTRLGCLGDLRKSSMVPFFCIVFLLSTCCLCVT